MLVKHSKRTVRKGCEFCGSTDLYYGHDTEYPHHDPCAECGGNGPLFFMERDGSVHACDSTKAPATRELPAAPTEPKESSVTSNPNEAAALDALRTLIGSPTIDRAEVERIAREVIGEVVFPTKTVVISDRDTREVEGNTHAKLADVILTLGIGEHAMMVGPAGTGKSTIAEQAAEALGLESYAISLSPQTPASQILGYMQATGDYVPSLFREAFENGGVFHFDEFDNGNPSILGVINAALANSRMAFPDGMVKRHDDFRCVASANTFGRGANRTYVGKNPIDASTLDRFSVIEIDIDEALESALCKANAASDADAAKVLDFVRKLRKNADKNGLNVVISPRAAVGMCRLLKGGMGWDDAVNARARRGVDDSTWNKLTA